MNGFGERATGIAAFIVGLVLAGTAGAAVVPSDFGADDGEPFVPARPPVSDRQTEVQNLDTGEWFATIFDALADPDTLDGHTLQVVAASIVEGQVLVGKSVTIQGAAGTEVVQMGVDTGTQDHDPWLTLTITAVPSTLVTGQTSALTAAVTLNSDGVDTSGLGWILDGTEIALSGTLGTVAPATVGTLGGVVGAVYTAGATLGMGSATAVLDNQSVTTPIEIVIPVELMRFSVD